MNKVFEYILIKFPDHRKTVADLYNNDEDFRILCEDYLTSVEALATSRQHLIEDKDYEREYLQLSMDLEQEIRLLLEAKR